MRRKIHEVRHLTDDVTSITVGLGNRDPTPKPGQFYMLRAWNNDPLLSRPIAVFRFDSERGELTFLIENVGTGTKILSDLQEDDYLTFYGPYGKELELDGSDLVLIGGGVGFAPLSYLCSTYRREFPEAKIHTFLGFRDRPYGTEDLKRNSSVVINCGGLITDNVEVKPGDTVVACGPQAMLETLCKSLPAENTLYIGVEAHMACGLGACLGCVRMLPLVYEQVKGSKTLLCMGEKQVKVCTEGPFFKREVLT